MTITSHLFEAYLKCPTKCWLRSRGEAGGSNAYADWVRTQEESYHSEGIKCLLEAVPHSERVIAPPATDNPKTAKWRLAVGLLVQAQNLESHLHAVERLPSEGRGNLAQFMAIRFAFTNKLTKDDKLLLAFDVRVLSELLGREVSLGRIIHGDDHATLKVKTSTLRSGVRTRTEKIAALLSSPSPPDLILNRHCAECEFRARCRQKAMEKDDLSLLANMTEKERKKFRSKGIFTVTQLSFTFRPRRRRRRLRDKREKYHHSLKALAIREQRIHVVGSQELKIEGTPVYLDVEGLPDRDFYYLIGVRIRNGDSVVQHSLWADSADEEKRIWTDFLGVLSGIENPVLVHYGSYETTFLKRMHERYGEPPDGSGPAKAIHSAVNLLSLIFAQVYFPTFSNGLKDIAGHLGFQWTDSAASGMQTIRWRHQWAASRAPSLKQSLLIYNAQDCEAVEVVASKLVELHLEKVTSPQGRQEIDFLGRPRQQTSEKGAEVHRAFDAIVKGAHATYQERRIIIKRYGRAGDASECGPQAGRPVLVRRWVYNLKPNRTVKVRRRLKCPRCGRPQPRPNRRMASLLVTDLKFTAQGVKRVVTKYVGPKINCSRCKDYFNPRAIAEFGRGRKYGEGFMAWAVHQRVVYRLPYRTIAQAALEMFNIHVGITSTGAFVEYFAQRHLKTEARLLEGILESTFLHVDETQISIQGINQYVWVFTDGQRVVFRITETRECDMVHEMLAGYNGILVTDFYGGYDAVKCRQQKCLVHLIRDINDDLWREPFNGEFEAFTLGVRDLFQPIFEDLQRYGSKKRHLSKHGHHVDRFYREHIDKKDYKSEVGTKYQKRFKRYRESLFTFLRDDSIPWNNNMAERAIRHIAVQRKISGAFGKRTIPQYLRLLGVAQSCRFQEKSFLKFLLSGKGDVNEYVERRRGCRVEIFRRRIPCAPEAG